MKDKPSLAIMIADKAAAKGKGSDEDEAELSKETGSEILAAIEKKDGAALVKTIQNICRASYK